MILLLALPAFAADGPAPKPAAAPVGTSAAAPAASVAGSSTGALTTDAPAAPPTPVDEVVTRYPALAAALGARDLDDADAAELAAILLAADARLVALLTPAAPGSALPDTRDEAAAVDLVDAEVWLEGTVLHGVARGRGVVQNGVWVDLDLAGGPAADLQLGYGRNWSRAVPLDGGATPVAGPMPTIGADRVDFQFDLATAGRGEARGWGSATARIRSADGRVEDAGPAGLVGAPPDEAVDVLVALLAEDVTDPDLAVAIAVTFGALRPLVADDVVAIVDADARAWLRYGQGLDAWLAERGADWRFGALDALGKLTWAWPAGQAFVYGAVPLVTQAAPLDAARWRFVVPSVGTLARLRDTAPFDPSRITVTRQVDDHVNGRLRYRTHDALMDNLCRNGVRSDEECKGWIADRKANANLGMLGDTAVPLWEGASASWQVGVAAREGVYVGDCATATVLAIAMMQSLGIPAIGMGWSGDDLGTPTHDVPLWYDGARFRATQRGPGPAWRGARAFVYVTLPAIHPVNAWTHGREPGGWTRGGAVAGGWTSYGDLTFLLRDGLPATVVGGWLDTQAAGGWPVF